MANLDIIQNNDLPHVALEMEPGIGEQQVTVEEVEMRTGERGDTLVNETEEQTTPGEITENIPENNVCTETEVVHQVRHIIIIYTHY